MANYFERILSELSNLGQDSKSTVRDSQMLQGLLGMMTTDNQPPVYDKSRYATTESVVSDRAPLDVVSQRGFQEYVVPNNGKIVEMSPLAEQYTDKNLVVPGYTPRMPAIDEDQAKDEMEAGLIDNTMKNLANIPEEGTAEGYAQHILNNMSDVGSAIRGLSPFGFTSDRQERTNAQQNTVKDIEASEETKLSNEGQVPELPVEAIKDSANQVVQTPEDVEKGLEEALTNADNQRIQMEKEFDKAEKEEMNIADAEEEGLLGSFGTAAKNYLNDRENMLNLAMAFNSMRDKPDAALTSHLSKQIEKIRERKGGSATVAHLRDLALKTDNPRLKAKYTQAADMAEKMPTMAKDIYKNVLKDTNEFSDKQFDKTQKLRKEFTGNKSIKDFKDQDAAFGRIVSSAKPREINGKVYYSGASDLALIFNYMKVLDPGSVVRESEFRSAEQAKAWLRDTEAEGVFSVPPEVKRQIDKATTGAFLTPTQRNEFVSKAADLYEGALKGYDDAIKDYTRIAEYSDLPVDIVLPQSGAVNRNFVQMSNVTKDLSPEAKAQFEKLPYVEKLMAIRQAGLSR